jgi:predicted nucleic acid-binding protein
MENEMVAADSTFLTLLIKPDAKAPLDPATRAPIDRLRDRIENLIADLVAQDETIIIPTPVLSEVLVLAGDAGPAYLDEIHGSRLFKVMPFDERAAIELAAVETEARGSGSKRAGSEGTWAKVRFDRQIVAIAKVNNVCRIYSDDDGLGKFAKRCGIDVVRSWELPLPPAKQLPITYGEDGTKDDQQGQGGAGPAEG